MGDISSHFGSDEITCKCGCGFVVVNPILIRLLEGIRARYGRPVNILSGCRCADHNAAVDGVNDSQHLYGTAADIYISAITPQDIADTAAELGADGIGVYPTFCHVDVRGSYARWEG